MNCLNSAEEIETNNGCCLFQENIFYQSKNSSRFKNQTGSNQFGTRINRSNHVQNQGERKNSLKSSSKPKVSLRKNNSRTHSLQKNKLQKTKDQTFQSSINATESIKKTNSPIIQTKSPQPVQRQKINQVIYIQQPYLKPIVEEKKTEQQFIGNYQAIRKHKFYQNSLNYFSNQDKSQTTEKKRRPPITRSLNDKEKQVKKSTHELTPGSHQKLNKQSLINSKTKIAITQNEEEESLNLSKFKKKSTKSIMQKSEDFQKKVEQSIIIIDFFNQSENQRKNFQANMKKKINANDK